MVVAIFKEKSHYYLEETTSMIFNRYGVDQVNYLSNNKKDEAWKLCLK